MSFEREDNTGKISLDRWEVGSEFQWMGLPPAPFIHWPEPAPGFSWALPHMVDDEDLSGSASISKVEQILQ